MAKFQTVITGKKNKKVIFLIGGWSYTYFYLFLTSKILARNGYYCISYTYDNSTFSPDTTKTVNDLLAIKQNILDKIHELKKQGYTSFDLFGTSLGSVIATSVANESSDISKLILNTIGGDTAKTVWSWDKVNAYFKKAIMEQGITFDQLHTQWKPISPIYNAENLTDKQILIYLTKKDKVIPYTQGKALIEKFKEKGYSYEVITNKYLNHALTGIFNLLRSKTYLSFLKK